MKKGNSSKLLYFDAFSGLSGDMILSSLISLLDIKASFLISELAKLNLKGYKIHIEKRSIRSIEGVSFKVEETEKQDKHRNLSNIKDILLLSSLNSSIIKGSLSVFDILASAEAKIHSTTKDKIHFHEVGAIDSIIDIVGINILLDHIGIDNIYSSPLPLAHGFVKCEHGLIPLPAPATIEILKGYPVYGIDTRGEYVTPTGAAFIKAFSKCINCYPSMSIEHIGYGIGSIKRKHPNMLRVIMGSIREAKGEKKLRLILMETNLDDISPEIIPYVQDKLFSAGALDVFTTAITMKRGRNGIKLSVLTYEDISEDMLSIIFRETTSIGIRRSYIKRDELVRKESVIESPNFGKIAFKESYFKNKLVQVKPEFRCLERIAKEKHIPLKILYNEFILEYEKSKDK